MLLWRDIKQLCFYAMVRAAMEMQLWVLFANFYIIDHIDCVTVQISHYDGWKQWTDLATIQCLGHTGMNYVYMPEANGWRNSSGVNKFHRPSQLDLFFSICAAEASTAWSILNPYSIKAEALWISHRDNQSQTAPVMKP